MELSEVEQAWREAGAEIRRGTKGSVLSASFQVAQPPTSLADLAELVRSWPKVRTLNLSGLPLSDAWNDVLLSRSELLELVLVDTPVDDELLVRFPELPKLKLVDVSGTRVSAEQLAAERKRQIRLRIVKRDG
ncbi:MAG: hypothetical protein KDA83_06310 [Planctomycetales bacterium]|nr:hypothetical protein [Planctomycetales bacterium]